MARVDDSIAAVITLTGADDERRLLLTSLEVHGHEIDPRREFLLCTALSMHVRTVLHLLQHTADLSAEIDVPHEGSTIIHQISVSPQLTEWFSGVSALFLQGMRDLAAQFPRQFSLTVTVAERN